MKTSSNASATRKAKRTTKASPKSRGAASAHSRVRIKKAATNHAIATDLAPAVAIALLGKTDQAPDAPSPALDCLAAGATPSETEGKVRVQLIFENGAVLPVEMSAAAGAALSKGLAEELPKK